MNKLRFSSIVVAAVAGVVGFGVLAFAGAVAASFAAPALHISAREGGSGYFAVAIGFLAGVLGFVGATWFALRWRGVRGISIMLGVVAAFILVMLSAASAVGIWYSMQPHVLNLNGPEPLLRVEIRPSPNQHDLANLTAELNTDRNGADVILEKAGDSLDTPRRGYVPLYYRTSRRLLVVKSPDGRDRIYNVRLPANPMPKKFHDWSPWQKPDFVNEPGSATARRASGESDIELRYRVETADD